MSKSARHRINDAEIGSYTLQVVRHAEEEDLNESGKEYSETSYASVGFRAIIA